MLNLNRIMIPLIMMFLACHAGGVTHAAENDIDLLMGELKSSEGSVNTDVGILHKKIGDYYSSIDDYDSASDHYVKALSMARDRFTIEERVQIAMYMSWGGRLDEAERELRLVLDEDRHNLAARVHLARVLSWSGQLNEAIALTDHILADQPGNRDVRLVKANSLRWMGKYRESILIYSDLLAEDEDFDARLGFTYALFQTGDTKGAKESQKLLLPQYAYQERELNSYQDFIKAEIGPSPDLRYDYYRDTDDNQFKRYTVGFGYRVKGWKGRMDYVHTNARDNTRDNRADSLSVSVKSNISDVIDVRVGAGLTFLDGSSNSNTLFTGSAGATKTYNNNSIDIDISRTSLTNTAELIENRIWMNGITLSSNYKFSKRISLNTSVGYRDYSDDNSSFDVKIAPQYSLYSVNPGIIIGYRLRYLDFENDTTGGYFDPDTFVSNELFSTITYDKNRVYCYLEPYAGHQHFRRSGIKESDIFGGGYGILGYRINSTSSVEVRAEGGNYAMSSASGFRYYMTGLMLSFTF